MPTYGYECAMCKEQFEVVQKITEPALSIHEDCGGELRRLLYPVGIVFKGSGFHVNDYAKKRGKDADTKPDAKAASASEPKTDTKAEPKSETKSDAPPSSAPASKPAATTP